MQNKNLTQTAKAKEIIKFRKATTTDLGEIKEALNNYTGRMCDVSAENLIFWNDYYQTYVHNGSRGFVIKFLTMDNTSCHVFPFDAKNKELIILLAKQAGGKICISCLTPGEAAYIGENFTVEGTHYSRDWDDYIYRAEDIINLTGKRYNGQRNHINKFQKLYPDYVYEKITNGNAADIKNFLIEFYGKRPPKTEMTSFETARLIKMFDDYESNGQLGDCLKVRGKVVGFSFGEVVCDTLIVHSEKTNTEYAGA